MKRFFNGAMAVGAMAGILGCMPTASGRTAKTSAITGKSAMDICKLSWDYEPVEYLNITDLGHYMVEIHGVSVNDIEGALVYGSGKNDIYVKGSCSGTAKKNSRNEVLVSHSMDVEISRRPGYLTRISDGKYDTLLITYGGSGTNYKYTPEELAKLDKDVDYLKFLPFTASDTMNEAGLYIAMDMRCGDAEGGMDCPGTNPGKPRACVLSAPSLVALNCGTVREAIDFLNDSYDWYTMAFTYENGDSIFWNMAFLIGDATGEYGLVEFGRNGVYFTPYQNFQSNYYIHPLLSERATVNMGHGRAAALLEGLMSVDTEQDIFENQKKARYRYQMENPSWEYYSDAHALTDVNIRRTLSDEELAAIYDKEIIHTGGFDDNMEKLEAYYNGDESGLRNDEFVWLGTITSGVNCAKKHATIEMWEDGTIFEVQW